MAEKKSGIDQALIRDLANILNDTDLTEIEVEQDDLRIRVSRAGNTQYIQAPMAAPAYAAAPAAIANLFRSSVPQQNRLEISFFPQGCGKLVHILRVLA